MAKARRHNLGQAARDEESVVWGRVIGELRAIREMMGIAAPELAHEDPIVYDEVFGELRAIREGIVVRLDAAAEPKGRGGPGHHVAVPVAHMLWSCGHFHLTKAQARECWLSQFPVWGCGHRHVTRAEAIECRNNRQAGLA